MHYSRHGFTLLELLLALAIASILLGIAIPSWSSFKSHLQSKLITERIIESISYARIEALLTHTQIIIKPINNNYQDGWEILKDKSILKIYPPVPLKITLKKLSKNNYIVIQSNGMTEGNNLSFNINDIYKVTLNRGGRTVISPLNTGQ